MLREFVAFDSLLRNFRSLRLSIGFAAIGLLCSFLIQSAVAAEITPPYGTTNFAGLGWGIGLSADFDVGGSRVNNTTLVNNIVRVIDSSTNVNVGFVLEAHYFLKAKETGGNDCHSTSPLLLLNCNDWATGPFVAIEIGGGTNATPTSGAITGYAIGWMVGLHHPDRSPTSNSSWNFGIGLRVDPGAKVLGDGIVANQPLPVGESSNPIRTKLEPRLGVMLLSSFSF